MERREIEDQAPDAQHAHQDVVPDFNAIFHYSDQESQKLRVIIDDPYIDGVHKSTCQTILRSVETLKEQLGQYTPYAPMLWMSYLGC